MTTRPRSLSVLCLAPLMLLGAVSSQPDHERPDERSPAQENADQALKVQYLEIVTPEVEKTCEALSQAHGVTFGEPIAQFGNARTARMKDGGLIGVRAPMRADEEPVVRPYVLVADIEAALKAAKAAGAQVAIPPMEIPGGHGTFAIYLLGGIDHGLWQL